MLPVNPTVTLIEPEVRQLIASRDYRALRDVLASLEPVDVADVLEELEPDDAAIAFRLLRREAGGDVLVHLDSDLQESLLSGLSSAALRAFEEMDPDDRAELIDELPPQLAKALVKGLSPDKRRRTQAILGYPPESVGRLMTPEYVRVRPEWSVERALEHLRRYGQDAETVHWVYVIDQGGRLIDDLHIRALLLADPGETVQSIMDEQFLSLPAAEDQEEAVRVMNRYDRSVMPVVDSHGVLLGIVTFDDISDVATEEATEDIQKLGGMEALRDQYLRVDLWNMLQKRGGWLVLLFIAQSMTIGVMGYFEEQFELAVLLSFVPLIIASGGNTGTQAASLLVRSLALDEVSPRDWSRVLRKELITGLLLGAALGVLGFAAVLVWNMTPMISTDRPVVVGVAVGAAVTGIVLWAVTLGAMFPLILQRLKLDPATISSPLVATMMDVTGLIIYFGVAVTILKIA